MTPISSSSALARRLDSSLGVVLAIAAAAGGLSAQALPDSVLLGRRSDLQRFRTDFMGVEASFSAPARADAERQLSRLEQEMDRLSPAGFDLALARTAALADNGHSGVRAGVRVARYNRIPLRLSPFGERFHVLRAAEGQVDLLGARLLSIDGHPMAELLATARTLAGGTDAWRDRTASYLFESPEQLHALGLSREPGQARYRFELVDGRTVERSISAEPPSDARNTTGPYGAFYPAPAGTEGWRSLLSPDRAPWALGEPGTPFRWRAAPELDALVIELRQTRNAPDRPIREFLAQMVRELETRRPQNVVLDMRMNGGGDLNTARDFMRSLPTLVPGRVFVLTGPWTFSAAISSVGYLKQAGPDKVTIVGEGVGDRLVFWAEGSSLRLPYTGAVIGRATERHDYRNGCKTFTDCHGPVVRNPIAVPTLDPELPAPWTIEAYRAGRDPALEAVAAALSQRDALSGHRDQIRRLGADGGVMITSNARYAAEDRGQTHYGQHYEVLPGGLDARGCLWGEKNGEIVGVYWHYFTGWDPATGKAFFYQSSPNGRVGFGYGGALGGEGHWLEQRFLGPGMAPRSRHETQWFGTDSVKTRSFSADLGGEWTFGRAYTWVRQPHRMAPC